MASLEEYLDSWIIKLDNPVKDGEYFGPTCPYARSAWINNKVKTVKVQEGWELNDFWETVSTECNNYDNKYEAVIVGATTNEHMINSLQLAGGTDALNTFLNTQNKNLWVLASHGEMFSILLIQKITDLDSQSKVLEKKNYYDVRYNDYAFNKNVVRRRKMREKLNLDND